MDKIISKEDVEHVSWLSKIKLNEEQINLFVKQFNEILSYFKKLDEVNTESTELKLYVTPLRNSIREDKIRESLPVEEALRNAPKKEKTFFKAPKIV